MTLLAWLEATWVGIWVRESLWGFPISIILHALGMGFLVGAHVAISLRLLGMAPGLPLTQLKHLNPLILASFALALASGLLLLLAFPAKSLTNPLFYLKLALIAIALWLGLRMQTYASQQGNGQRASSGRARKLALASLLCWAGGITVGRFLAYTYRMLLVN